jgi:STE24 endopeptidase
MPFYQTTFFWIFFLFYAAHELLTLGLEILNYHHAKKQTDFPAEYAGFITTETFERSQAYTMEKIRFSVAAHLAQIPFFWFLIVCGGFNVLDAYAGLHAGVGTLSHSVLFCVYVALYFALITLPFKIYSVFVIEEKYGFNHTTWGLFFLDLGKSLVVSAALGLPILSVAFWLMNTASHLWWLYVWGAILLFQFFVTALYPTFLAPLFNKFTPLADGELREKIISLAQKTKFAIAGIFVMDGSRRSAHSNAYFAGLGKFRRIVVFDTLMHQLSTDELTAVIAHEIGHNKKKHIRNFMLLSAALSLVGFFILSLLIGWPSFYTAFNIATPSHHTALVIFVLVSETFTFVLTPLMNGLSRRNEYQADAFAANALQATNPLQTALLKLARDNLSNLSPHPVYSFYHYSHPELAERLAHLSKIDSEHEA